MVEIGKETFYAAFNISKGFLTKESPDRYREVIPGVFGPVIVIRGFGEKPSLPEARIKHAMNKTSVGGILAGISPVNKSIDFYVPQLQEEVEKIDGKVTLVGFSLGGLIALRYIYKNGWTDKISGVITIGSPFNGIPALKFAGTGNEMFRDLNPQSKVLKDVRELKNPPGKAINLFAKWDEFVGDPNRINTQGKKIVLPIGGHHNFLSDLRVSKSVMEIVISSFSSP